MAIVLFACIHFLSSEFLFFFGNVSNFFSAGFCWCFVLSFIFYESFLLNVYVRDREVWGDMLMFVRFLRMRGIVPRFVEFVFSWRRYFLGVCKWISTEEQRQLPAWELMCCRGFNTSTLYSLKYFWYGTYIFKILWSCHSSVTTRDPVRTELVQYRYSGLRII